MEINIRKAVKSDYPAMVKIWNEVVEDGIAFPQLDLLDENSGAEFFGSQTYCAVAENTESHEILGLYILHPNNVGRCGHICNASYAVKSSARNLHIGEKLVSDCLVQGKENGFKILQRSCKVKSFCPTSLQKTRFCRAWYNSKRIFAQKRRLRRHSNLLSHTLIYT